MIDEFEGVDEGDEEVVEDSRLSGRAKLAAVGLVVFTVIKEVSIVYAVVGMNHNASLEEKVGYAVGAVLLDVVTSPTLWGGVVYLAHQSRARIRDLLNVELVSEV